MRLSVVPSAELAKTIVFLGRDNTLVENAGLDVRLTQTVNKFWIAAVVSSAWIRGCEFGFVGCEPIAQVHRPVTQLLQILKFLRKVILEHDVLRSPRRV